MRTIEQSDLRAQICAVMHLLPLFCTCVLAHVVAKQGHKFVFPVRLEVAKQGNVRRSVDRASVSLKDSVLDWSWGVA